MDEKLSGLPANIKSNISRYLTTPTADAMRSDYEDFTYRREQDSELDNFYKKTFKAYLRAKELDRDTELLYNADLEEVYNDFKDFAENALSYRYTRPNVLQSDAYAFVNGKRLRGFFLSDMRKFRSESGASQGGRRKRTKGRSLRSRSSRRRTSKGGKRKNRKTRRH